MIVISIINFKGGVGKTVSAINMAHVLADVHGKRVLLIDCDKQGNVSKFFGLYAECDHTLASVLTSKNPDVIPAICKTKYANLDIITADMRLLNANREILLDVTRAQQNRLTKALMHVNDQYDFCIIDCAPDINMSVINALVASDDILVPIKVDKFTFDGLAQLREQIEDLKEFNPKLRLAGCFITMETRNNVNAEGVKWLEDETDYPVFRTGIRKTVKIDETTFTGKPILEYAKNCTAAVDYVKLVEEYLQEKVPLCGNLMLR